MCYYSTLGLKSRLAEVGETLALLKFKFEGNSKGLVSADDYQAIMNSRLPTKEKLHKRLWRAIFYQEPTPCLVCIPPGTTLLLTSIPTLLQKILSISDAEFVTFYQKGPEIDSFYRDGIRLSSGKEVLLQHLPEGIAVTVYSLIPKEEFEKTEEPTYA